MSPLEKKRERQLVAQSTRLAKVSQSGHPFIKKLKE